MAGSSASTILANIFTAPTEAFAAIRERPSPWLPLVLLVGAYSAVSFTYLSSVDLAWMFDRMMQNAPNLTAEQRAQAVEVQASLSPYTLGSFASGSAAVSFLVVFALVALYLTGVSAAMKAGIHFKQWFALLAWCTLPFVLGLIASLANVLFNDVRFMPQEALNPLSFGNLLGIDVASAPLSQRMVASLDLTTIWCVALQVLGFQAWTGRATAVAAAVVLAPVAVVFGIVGMVA